MACRPAHLRPPALQVRDAGNLLTRAGLALPAVDVDSFQMRYPSAADLVEHLRVGVLGLLLLLGHAAAGGSLLGRAAAGPR